MKGDIITEKDRKDIRFAVQHGADYVALSFVQTGDDVLRLRHFLDDLDPEVKIIAKVETKSASENLIRHCSSIRRRYGSKGRFGG
jgi:pyruvate kinase